MSQPAVLEDFAVSEWHRLSRIAEKYEAPMRLAYTRAMRNGVNLDKLQLRKVIIDIMSETCVTTSHVYGLVFNPNSESYIEAVDRLTEKYYRTVDNKEARDAVRRILPRDISLEDRKRRLNTFGLDTKSAVEIERYRQTIGDGPSHIHDVERVRADAVRRRGNLLALTETNRVINTSLETLWLDNQSVSKADVVYYDRSIRDIGNIPKRARKIIVTRRDDRVCKYCDPLDGIKARLGEQFETDYGFFDTPPFHPRCRCFLIVSS